MQMCEQTQPAKRGDVDRSHAAPQRLAPGRLPRLRRCACCLSPREVRRAEFLCHRYYVGASAAQYTLEGSLQAARSHLATMQERWGDAEIIRVLVFGGDYAGHSYQYEVVRGGRWVNDWQGHYGRHAHESRDWIRRGP